MTGEDWDMESGAGLDKTPSHRRGALLSVAIGLITFVYLMLTVPTLERHLVDKDHGYQIALGRQIDLGERLMVDVMTHYGPGIAYASALAVRVTPESPIAEMVLCAAGYAAAIGFSASIAARRRGAVTACVLAVLLILALGRFYKWYYWLLPVLSVWAGLRVLDAESRRGALLMGFVAGVAWLFRVEIGLASIAIAVGAIVGGALVGLPAIGMRGGIGRAVRTGALAAIGMLVPVGAWSVLLISRGGVDAFVGQYTFYFDAAGDLVESLAIAPFAFDASDPFGPASRTAFAQVLTLATCLLAITNGAAGLLVKESADRHAMISAGFIGASAVAVLPQAFHRADAPHLAQTIPLVLLSLVFAIAVKTKSGYGQRPPTVSRDVGVVARVLGVLWIVALFGLPLPKDRASPTDDPMGRLARIVEADLDAVDSTFAAMLAEANRVTPPDGRVLFLPRAQEKLRYEAQVYYWVRRPLAGTLQAYYYELFATPPWPAQNLDRIRAHPPAVVIAAHRFLEAEYRNETLERFHPERWSYVRERYTEAAYENGVWVLLVAGEDARPTNGPPAGSP